jgi:hypothetical protein
MLIALNSSRRRTHNQRQGEVFGPAAPSTATDFGNGRLIF